MESKQVDLFTYQNDLSTKQWLIYEYIKSFAIGKNNAIGGDKLIESLQTAFPHIFYDYSKVKLQADIRKIRMSDNTSRRIGSSGRGYWAMTEEDVASGIEFLQRLAVTHILTALKQGVSPNYFYKVLSEAECGLPIDKQQKFKWTKDENNEVRTLTDEKRRS